MNLPTVAHIFMSSRVYFRNNALCTICRHVHNLPPIKLTCLFPTICCFRNTKLYQIYARPPSWYFNFCNYIHSI